MILLDYETHYEPGRKPGSYSLSVMPTAQYVRDARFRCLGAALAGAGTPIHWRPDDRPAAWLQAHLPGSTAVAHNAAFDGLIALERHHAAPPALWLDTMLLARWHISQGTLPADQRTNLARLAEYFDLAPKGDTAAAVAAGGEDLARYAEHDLRLTAEILARLLPGTPSLERAVMDLHVRMATEPVLVLDRETLQREADAETCPTDIAKAVGSADTFAGLLRARGVEPGTKISPRTGKQAYAFAKTDGFMQGLAEHPDPIVRRLAGWRLATKSTIGRTRAQRLLDVGSPLPVPLLYYGAHTGRSSGLDKLNLQNLPRGSALRQAIRAPEGHTLVVCDSKQGEVATIAWLAQDPVLLDTVRRAFAGTGPDIYTAFAASTMFHVEPGAVTSEQRRVAKPPMLAAGFGQGANGLVAYAERMGVTLSPRQAEAAVAGYRSRFARIPALWKRLEAELLRSGELCLPSGRKLTYPDLRREGRDLAYERAVIFSKSAGRDTVRLWHGLLTENAVQATHRDVVFWQIVQLAKRWRVVLMAHDEVVLCVPEEAAKDALHDALHWFGQVPDWADGLPMAGEAVITPHYGEKP